MAISTYKTYLMYKATSSSSYSKLIDIVEFPGMRDAPESLDTTTLSNGNYTSIPGLSGSSDGLEFLANYTKTDFTTVKALEGASHDFAVWIGADSGGDPDGSDGKFSFTGTLHVGLNGGGVNEVTRMTITIFPSTDISFE